MGGYSEGVIAGHKLEIRKVADGLGYHWPMSLKIFELLLIFHDAACWECDLNLHLPNAGRLAITMLCELSSTCAEGESIASVLILAISVYVVQHVHSGGVHLRQQKWWIGSS